MHMRCLANINVKYCTINNASDLWVLVHELHTISGKFDGDFNLANFSLVANLKSPLMLFLKGYYISIFGQSVKLNICQSVFTVKSPNLMSTEFTTPTVHTLKVLITKTNL